MSKKLAKLERRIVRFVVNAQINGDKAVGSYSSNQLGIGFLIQKKLKWHKEQNHELSLGPIEAVEAKVDHAIEIFKEALRRHNDHVLKIHDRNPDTVEVTA